MSTAGDAAHGSDLERPPSEREHDLCRSDGETVHGSDLERPLVGVPPGAGSSGRDHAKNSPVLALENVLVRFESRDGVPITAVDNVSLRVKRRETVGLVGETGCGKSTLARAALKLLPVQGGSVRLLGRDLQSLHREELRSLRRYCQMVFQDPRGSLNPRMNVESIIAEPLRVHGMGDREERQESVREMMKLVGLSEDLLDRRPVQLSGGQQQRVGIARALITRPALVICDEPVSALDVSIRAQILNLLADLAGQTGGLVSIHCPRPCSGSPFERSSGRDVSGANC